MTFIDIPVKKECEITRIVYCLLIVSQGLAGQYETLNFYSTKRGLDIALKYHQRKNTFTETVFFTFELPIDFYLDKAQKHI